MLSEEKKAIAKAMVMEMKKEKVMQLLVDAKETFEASIEDVDSILAEIENTETVEELCGKLTNSKIKEVKDFTRIAKHLIKEVILEAEDEDSCTTGWRQLEKRSQLEKRK